MHHSPQLSHLSPILTPCELSDYRCHMIEDYDARRLTFDCSFRSSFIGRNLLAIVYHLLYLYTCVVVSYDDQVFECSHLLIPMLVKTVLEFVDRFG